MQWCFKKFCKGDKSLEDKELSGQLSEVDNGQLRASLKLILVQLHEKLCKNSALTILSSFGHRSKLKKWKSLISECLKNWSQIKKSLFLKCSLFLHNNNEPFLDPTMMCDGKWILYNQRWPVQWLDREEAPEHFPKLNLHPKKDHGHCLVVYCWSDALQLSESWRNHYVWEVRSANWWDALKMAIPAAGIGQQKGPSSFPQQCFII